MQPDRSNLEVDPLDQFEVLAAELVNQIRSKYLAGISKPDWTQSEDHFSRGLPKYLHKRFRLHPRLAGTGLASFYPASILLTLAVPFSLVLEPMYPMLFWVAQRPGAFRVSIERIPFFLAFLLMVVIVPYVPIGAYWTAIQTLSNRKVLKPLRFVAIGAMIAALGTWIALGSRLLWTPDIAADFADSPRFAAYYFLVRDSLLYRILVAIFVYVPAICFSVVWMLRLFIDVLVDLASAIRWVVKVQVMQSMNAVKDLALARFLSGGSEALVDLSLEQITALHDWSLVRRQIIQNRLIPSTILLAFIGALANTSLGETAISLVGTVLREYFQSEGFVESMLAYGRFLGLGMLIVFPIHLIAELITQSYIMDLLVESSLLARSAKLIAPKPQLSIRTDQLTPPIRRLISWIWRILAG